MKDQKTSRAPVLRNSEVIAKSKAPIAEWEAEMAKKMIHLMQQNVTKGEKSSRRINGDTTCR